MPRPKQRTPELGGRLLEAALRIIDRDGVAALTARGLAEEAQTSPAAIYELFGDKSGVVRAMFFSGFRQLGLELSRLEPTADPGGDLLALAQCYRRFILGHRALSAVMFSRPYATFDPAPEESAAGSAVRELILAAVSRAADSQRLEGDPTDIAHAYVALIHGLAAAEASERLGSSPSSVERRWEVAIRALLRGFALAAAGV